MASSVQTAQSLKALAELKGVETGVAKSSDLFMVDPRNVLVQDGWNPRKVDPKRVEEMKVAMKAGAVFPPLGVYVADGEILLVAGEHRLNAYIQLIAEGTDIARVPAIVVKGNDADRFDFTINENAGVGYTPLELAGAYRTQRDLHGRTIAEIAAKRGKTTQHVTDCLALLDMDASVQKAVQAGEVSATTARKVSKAHGKDAGKVIAEGVKAAKEKGKKKATAKNLPDKAAKPPKGDSGATPAEVARGMLAGLRKLSDTEGVDPAIAMAAKALRRAVGEVVPGAEEMTLAEGIRAEIDSNGLAMVETSCPEHAALFTAFRAFLAR